MHIICVYIYMYSCMYIYVYVCAHIHMYIATYIDVQTFLGWICSLELFCHSESQVIVCRHASDTAWTAQACRMTACWAGLRCLANGYILLRSRSIGAKDSDYMARQVLKMPRKQTAVPTQALPWNPRYPREAGQCE